MQRLLDFDRTGRLIDRARTSRFDARVLADPFVAG
jgi:hypothetical protein